MTPIQQKDIEHIIWNKEQAIFAGRAKGDMMPYVSMIHPDFLAWPPPLSTPVTASEFIANNSRPEALPPGEKIKLFSNGMSVNRDLVVSYFTTHRTMRPNNEPVDEKFENVHVWRMHDGEWKVVASMARPV